MVLFEDYSDIINLPRHVSPTRHPMSMRDRAAQFSPFAALTGYDRCISEEARLTDSKKELTEEEKQEIEQRLQILDNSEGSPLIRVTYFKADDKKSGGGYETVSGEFKRVDLYQRTLNLRSGEKIAIEDILDIEGEVFGFLRGDFSEGVI